MLFKVPNAPGQVRSTAKRRSLSASSDPCAAGFVVIPVCASGVRERKHRSTAATPKAGQGWLQAARSQQTRGHRLSVKFSEGILSLHGYLGSNVILSCWDATRADALQAANEQHSWQCRDDFMLLCIIQYATELLWRREDYLEGLGVCKLGGSGDSVRHGSRPVRPAGSCVIHGICQLHMPRHAFQLQAL